MVTSIKEVMKRVADLPRHQRLMLVKLLLDLDRSESVEEIDVAWEQEIRARMKAVDEGRVAGVPYEQIQKEMAVRFSQR